MQKITNRELQGSDIEMVIDYRILFLNELQGHQSPEQEAQLRRELFTYFTHAFSDKSFTGIVATVNNEPVGFGGMVIQKIPGNFEIMHGFEGYILNMYTLPEHRKKGIAAHILNSLIEKGRTLQLDKVYLHAAEDGIALYRRSGFKDPSWPVLELFTGRNC